NCSRGPPPPTAASMGGISIGYHTRTEGHDNPPFRPPHRLHRRAENGRTTRPRRVRRSSLISHFHSHRGTYFPVYWIRSNTPVPPLNSLSITQASRRRTWRLPSGLKRKSTGRRRPVTKDRATAGFAGSRVLIQP